MLALFAAIVLLDGALYLAARESAAAQAVEVAELAAQTVAGQLSVIPPSEAAELLAKAEQRGLGRMTLFAPTGEVLAGRAADRPAELGVVLTGRTAERRSSAGGVQVMAPVGGPGRPRAALLVEVATPGAILGPWWALIHALAMVAMAWATVFEVGTRFVKMLAASEQDVREGEEAGGIRGGQSAQVLRLEEANARLEEANEALREAQEALVQSERLAGVGRLAAGLAHELGNPLAAIRGWLEVLRGDLEGGDGRGGSGGREGAELVRRCEREVERMHGILRGVLEVSRPGRPFERVELGRMLREIAQGVMAPGVGGAPGLGGVVVEVEPGGAGLACWGDAGRLRQAVWNLARNAAEAGARRIVLGARIEAMSTRQRGEGRGEAREGRGGVVVWCKDDGAGIAAEALPRLFEPFFTTKTPGQGTGLGLWIVHQVMEQHRGWVEVESVPGEGATFCLYLPEAGAGD